MGVDSTNVYDILSNYIRIGNHIPSQFIVIRTDHSIMYIINVVDFIFQHLEALNSQFKLTFKNSALSLIQRHNNACSVYTNISKSPAMQLHVVLLLDA